MIFRLIMVLWLVLFGVLLAWKETQAVESSPTPFNLNTIIELALEHNPTITGAHASIDQSRGQQVSAGAYPNPSIIGSAGRGSIRDPSTGISITERTIVVQQPLEWPAKRQARQRAAEAGLAGASAGLDEAKLNLVAEVKVAFYQLLLSQRDIEVSAQNLAMVKDVLRTVTVRVGAGEATKFDLMKANVEVQKATKEVARSQNAVLTARGALNTRTAGALGSAFAIQGDFEPLRQELNLESLTARALEDHPTVRRLSRLVDQADHAVTYEKESRMPNISVLGEYHREAGDESVTGGLSVPIPVWYRRQGEIQTALADKHRLLAERERLQNELIQALTQHTQEARTAKEQIDVFEQGLLKQAEETLRIAKFSFQQGAASLLEVLDAQRVYRQTLLEYAQTRTELSIALARLERASGGRQSK
jgi:cobalt-zinc-cadmium efflux system outer membrane protein